MKIRKGNFFILLTSPLLVLIAFLFSLQGPNFSKDYWGYYYYFLNLPNNVEPFFKVVVSSLHKLDLGLSWLFFTFLFFALLLKIKFVLNLKNKENLSPINIVLFVIFYVVVFFPLWDLTQIRLGLGVSFFLLGFTLKNKTYKFLFYCLAISNHFSLIIILLALFIYSLINSKYIKVIIAIIINVGILSLLKISFYQESYENYNFNEVIQFFSPKMIVVAISILFSVFQIFHYRDFDSKKIGLLYVSFFVYISYLFLYSSYPVISIRLLELSMFFSILYLCYIKQRKLVISYNFVLLSALSVYYINLYYLSDNSLIILKNWGY